MIEELEVFKQRALNNSEEAIRSNNEPRAEANKALLRILEITSDLVRQKDLDSFLLFKSRRYEIKNEQSTIIDSIRRWMNRGETMFESLLDLGEMTFRGFSESGFLEELEKGKKVNAHILASADIWTNLLYFVLRNISPEEAQEVKGDFETARAKVQEYKPYIDGLAKVLNKRQFLILYAWNFNEIDFEQEKEIVRDFDEWLDALKKGDLDHRSQLFEDETLKRVHSAFNLVRNGQSPVVERIDFEYWTLSDLYKNHPNGKSPEFWLALLEAIRARREKLMRQSEGSSD